MHTCVVQTCVGLTWVVNNEHERDYLAMVELDKTLKKLIIMETKLKFEVGDKVRVKSLKWYNRTRGLSGCIMQGRIFTKDMIEYCGKILTIEAVCTDYYAVEGNSNYWQDWMLEDEAVTEIETKEMTLKEAQDFVNKKKIICLSEEETIKVQKKLFELEIGWSIRGKEVCINYFLLFIEDKKITFTPNIACWVKDGKEKIEVSEILAIQIKEEKPKFDPKTLLPYDKVLARNNNDRWCARFYDYYEDGVFCTASGEFWDICIPYNEETQHLHGTTDEEPDFYRIFK